MNNNTLPQFLTNDPVKEFFKVLLSTSGLAANPLLHFREEREIKINHHKSVMEMNERQRQGDIQSPMHFVCALGQGTKKDTNNQINFLFWECDSKVRSLEDKYNDDERIGLPATIKMWTGSKSVHGYLLLDRMYPLEEVVPVFVQFQRKLNNKYGIDADGYSWTDEGAFGQLAAKTMRVPGFCHAKTGNESTICDINPSRIYTLAQIKEWLGDESQYLGEWDKNAQIFKPYISPDEREALKAKKQEEAKLQQAARQVKLEALAKARAERGESISTNENGETVVSILDFLSKRNLSIYEAGSIHGFKNAEGVALSVDLFACQKHLEDAGLQVEETAAELFYEYCQRSGLPANEIIARQDFGEARALAGASPASTAFEIKLNRALGLEIPKNLVEKVKLAQRFSPATAPAETSQAPTPSLSEDNDEWGEVFVASSPTASKPFSAEVQQIDNNLGWDFLQLLQESLEIQPDDHRMANAWMAHQREPNAKNGMFAVGNLTAVQKLLLEKTIYISDSAESKFENFIYWDYSGEHLGQYSKTEKFIISLLRENKFSIYIEANTKYEFLFKKLTDNGIDTRLYAIDTENKITWGAGGWFASQRETFQADLEISRKYLVNQSTRYDGSTQADGNQFWQEICQKYQELNPTSGIKSPKVLFLKSEMGTGKTEFVEWLINGYARQLGASIKVMAIYNLEKLVVAIAERLQLAIYSQGGEAGRSTNELSIADSDYNGLAITPHSLKKDGYAHFNLKVWKDFKGYKILFLDEIESLLKTLCEGQDLKNRGAIQEQFVEVIKYFISDPSCKIVCADANLSQNTIDFLKNVVEEDGVLDWENIPSLVVENKWQFENRQAVIWEDKHAMYGHMALSAQKHPIFFASDNKEIKGEKSYFATQSIRKTLVALGCDCSVVDAEVTKISDDPDHKLLTELSKNKSDIINDHKTSLGFSPSGATGISLKNTHFQNVYGFFTGVTGFNTCQQMAERVRDNVTRHFFINKFHLFQNSNKRYPYKAEEAERTSTNLNLQGFAQAFEVVAETEGFKEIQDNYKDETSPFKQWRRRDNYLDGWLGCQLRTNIIASLQMRGYSLQMGSPKQFEGLVAYNSDSELYDHINNIIGQSGEINHAYFESHKALIAERANQVGDELYQKGLESQEEKEKCIKKLESWLYEAKTITKAEDYLAKGYQVRQWQGFTTEATTPEIVDIFLKKRYQAELGFLVYSENSGLGTAQSLAIYSDARYFHQDMQARLKREVRSKYAQYNLLINVLKFDKFVSWLNNQEYYHAATSEIAKYHELVLKPHAQEIKTLLGITINPDSNRRVSVVGSLLRACGLSQRKVKHERGKQYNNKSERARLYALEPINQHMLAIWDGWASDSFALERKEAYDKMDAIETIKKLVSELEAKWASESEQFATHQITMPEDASAEDATSFDPPQHQSQYQRQPEYCQTE